jgi:dihydrofolate reductase
MGRVIYSMNVSLDGYVEDRDRGLDWGHVDEELHSWFNDGAREAAVFVYGRRLYELMAAYWPTAESDPSTTAVERDFAHIWVAKPKVVFSTSLAAVDWNSRLARGDVGAELARLRAEFDGDLDLGGPTLAASFIQRRLVDVYRLLVHPVILGGGTPFFPALDSPLRLRQTQTRRFDSGVVCLEYVPE